MNYEEAKAIAKVSDSDSYSLGAEFSVPFMGRCYEVAFKKCGDLDSVIDVTDGPSHWVSEFYEMPSVMLDMLAHLSTLDFRFMRWSDCEEVKH